MKKLFILILMLFPTIAFADTVTDGMGIAGDSIYKYTPVVRSLCYTIACIIGIISAFSIYYAIQNNDPNTKKKIITYGGSCITMVCMAIALPQFFNYQESGLIAGNQGGVDSNGSNGNFAGGDNYDDIITDIPSLDNPNWRPDPQFPSISIPDKDDMWKPNGGGGQILIPGGNKPEINVPVLRPGKMCYTTKK